MGRSCPFLSHEVGHHVCTCEHGENEDPAPDAHERRELGLHSRRVRKCIRGGLLRAKGMDMNAPFFDFGLFGEGTSFIVAFFVGIGFGFFLERAGFGSARKLAAQFYFTDLTVFKVMFTAVVTALLGLFWLSWIGFLDLSRAKLLPSYPLPP